MLLKPKTRKKLQDFISAMPEETLAVLIRGIEKSRLTGKDDPLTNMILFTARQNAQAQNSKMPRVPGPLRLFSIPFESFLVNSTVGPKQLARIDRASVLKVWQWLARDVIPDKLGRLSEQAKMAVVAGNQPKAREFIELLRAAAVKSIHGVVTNFERYPKDRGRIAGQLGGEQVLGDAIDIANVLACEEDLRVLQKRFSSRITTLQDDEISWCLNQLEGFCARNPEMLPHGFSLIMQQLARPAEIVRLAKTFLGTDDALKIEAHPYGAAVDMVLYDTQSKIKEICEHINANEDIEQIGVLITTYHDLMHYLQIEIEFPSSCDWSATIVKLRSRLSERLSTKLEEAPRLIKSALKADEEGMEAPVTEDVEAAEFVLRLMNICHLAAGELALNELLSRIRREVEQFLNVMGDAAVESLRNSSSTQRVAAQARADAAVRLSQIVFGDEISVLLRKASNIARQAAEEPVEYKMADSA